MPNIRNWGAVERKVDSVIHWIAIFLTVVKMIKIYKSTNIELII